ncbi:MAG: endonuclease III [Elusimicrobiaceae bacterium]|nr:endonuclease III [Elusimicrobiaceae bacterium]
MPKSNARVLALLKELKKLYPKHVIPLHHHSAWELLCAVILSAQCTDARVNTITPHLFKKYPTVQALAKADIQAVEAIIHAAGFYHSKALSLVEMSKRICEVYDGEVPQNMEDLLTLRGVARKTANVMLGDYFKKPGDIVVDTHVKRLAFRLGLTKQTDPVKIEKDLTKIIPYEYWGWIAIALILHGRSICPARKPNCDRCTLKNLCPQKGLKK